MKQILKCIRPSSTIRRLLKESLEGQLVKAGREADNERLRLHLEKCAFCRDVHVEWAHENVTIPFLKRIAKEQNVPFKKFYAAFRKQVEQEIAGGRFRRRQTRRKE